MWGTKLAYGALMIGAVFFFFLYRGSLSMVLLVLAFVFPLVLFVLLRLLARQLRVQLSVDRAVQNKEDPITVTVTLHNPTRLPLPHATLLLQYCNLLDGRTEEISVTSPVPAKNAQSVLLTLSSAYCGRIRISISAVRLLDYIRLWSRKLHPSAGAEVLILPQSWPIGLYLSQQTLQVQDSDRFSEQKSGDDPSEVFGIRSYQPGDAPNRIHWKLSSKSDDLLVKEYSLPVTNAVCLLLDWSNANLALLSAMAETMFSISDQLAALSVLHSVTWRQQDSVVTRQISAPEDVFVAASLLLKTQASTKRHEILSGIPSTVPMAHLLYLTTELNSEILQRISEQNAIHKTVLLLHLPEQVPATYAEELVQVIPVTAGAVSDSLQELLL